MGTNAAIVVLIATLTGCNFAVQGFVPPSGGGAAQPGGQVPVASDDAGAASPDLDTPTNPTNPAPPNPSPSTPLGALGDGCDPAHPCDAALTCFTSLGAGPNSTQFPGGYCSRACSNNSPCPSGSECAALKGGSICVVHCSDTCRAMYTCCKSNLDSDSCVPDGACGGGGPGGGGPA